MFETISLNSLLHCVSYVNLASTVKVNKATLYSCVCVINLQVTANAHRVVFSAFSISSFQYYGGFYACVSANVNVNSCAAVCVCVSYRTDFVDLPNATDDWRQTMPPTMATTSATNGTQTRCLQSVTCTRACVSQCVCVCVFERECLMICSSSSLSRCSPFA